MKKLSYKSWLDKRINSVDYLGTDLALAAWDYQAEKIAHLEAENERLDWQYQEILKRRKEKRELESRIEKLREAFNALLFHLTDYNTGEESFVLAMEIEKARAALEEDGNDS